MDCHANIGSEAKFSVVATGTKPFKYQWYMNDTPIPGKTESEFLIPQIEAVHNMAKIWVHVSNPFDDIKSHEATLRVSDAPATPRAGDFRFKHLNAYPMGLAAGNIETFLSAEENKTTSSLTLNGRFGTPLPISRGLNLESETFRFTWPYYAPTVPGSTPQINTSYFSGEYDAFEAYLEARLKDENSIITSMECVKNGCFAFSLIQSPDINKFKAHYQAVAVSDFTKHVQTESGEGRLITAFAYKDGQVHSVSYTWKGDLRQHEMVVSEPLGQAALITKIMQLAKDGYIITALGGDAKAGYQVIGTRIESDQHGSRPTELVNTREDLKALLLRGFTVMAALGSEDDEPIWICQQ